MKELITIVAGATLLLTACSASTQSNSEAGIAKSWIDKDTGDWLAWLKVNDTAKGAKCAGEECTNCFSTRREYFNETYTELKEKRKESDEKKDGAKWIICRNKVINIARTPQR